MSFDIIWPQGTHTEKWLNHPKQCQVTFGLWTQTPLIGVGPVQTIRNTPQRFRWACLTYSLGFPTIFSVVFNGTGCDPPKVLFRECDDAAKAISRRPLAGCIPCVLSVPSYPIFGGSRSRTFIMLLCFDRRKFRSQTSDNMDRWKSRGEKSQRREEQKREGQRRERELEERRCRCVKR